MNYDPETIYKTGLNELWNMLQTNLDDEDEEGIIYRIKYHEEIRQVKTGINLKIPIYYLTNEWYELYPTTKKVAVKGHGKYHLLDFMKEKEERENILRKILLEEYDDGITTMPRNMVKT